MLSARHQRNLEQIEAHLRRTDRRLARRFSVFGELVAGEEMPRRENVRPTPWQRMAELGWRAHRSIGRDWRPAMLLLLIPALILAVTWTLIATAPSRPSAACARPGPGASSEAQPVPGQLAGAPPYCPNRAPGKHH